MLDRICFTGGFVATVNGKSIDLLIGRITILIFYQVITICDITDFRYSIRNRYRLHFIAAIHSTVTDLGYCARKDHFFQIRHIKE